MKDTTYTALKTAAERIAANNFAAQKAAWLKAGRKASTYRFTITPEHAEIVRAMGDRDISDEAAMFLLHTYDALKQRLGGDK